MKEWRVDRTSGKQLHLQIREYILQQVQSDEWKIGQKIPTQRALSEHLNVNRSTVAAAIDELTAEGVLEGKTKRGTIVKSSSWLDLSKKNLDWQFYIRSGVQKPSQYFVKRLYELGHTPGIIKLSSAKPAPGIYQEGLTKLVSQTFTDEKIPLGYEEPLGYYPLRVQLSNYLKTAGITASPKQILITSGAIQALHLISASLLYPGSTILTESPSYLFSIGVFQTAKIKPYGIPMDDEGILINRVLKARHQTNASALYTIPNFQNPTGILMSESRKESLLQNCTKEGLPILEDDIYRELYFDDAPTTLKSKDETDSVIFIGSLSKSLTPGFRLGWIVASEEVVDRLADTKMQVDYGTSSLSQVIAEKMLSTGFYQRTLFDFRVEMKKRRDHLLRDLETHLSEYATWNKPVGGFFVWLKINKNISMKVVFDDLVEKGVLICPGVIYHHDAGQFIRISYSNASYEELTEAILILSAVIKNHYH